MRRRITGLWYDLRPAALVVVGVVLVTGGCSSSSSDGARSSVPSTTVAAPAVAYAIEAERTIESAILMETGDAADASCDVPPNGDTGTVFACDATDEGGTVYKFAATIDAAGHVTIAPRG